MYVWILQMAKCLGKQRPEDCRTSGRLTIKTSANPCTFLRIPVQHAIASFSRCTPCPSVCCLPNLLGNTMRWIWGYFDGSNGVKQSMYNCGSKPSIIVSTNVNLPLPLLVRNKQLVRASLGSNQAPSESCFATNPMNIERFSMRSIRL